MESEHSGHASGHEDHDLHGTVLRRNASYMLRQFCPDEYFWGTMYGKGILTEQQVDKIKEYEKISERIREFLFILSHRGAQAFDTFCECLIESEHSHVADQLKQDEATEVFRRAIQSKVSSPADVEECVQIWKDNQSAMKLSTEYVYEQKYLQQEEELRNHFEQRQASWRECEKAARIVAEEIRKGDLTAEVLDHRKNQLQKLIDTSQSDNEERNDKCDFIADMINILNYLETQAGTSQ